MKYMRVMEESKSKECGIETPIDEVVVSRDWDSNAIERDDIKGINFSTEESILRWIRNGNTLYDVIIPEDAEVKKVPGTYTPNGLFRANKLIMTNPRKLTQELVLQLYEKSKMPEKTYHAVLPILATRKFTVAADKLIEERINKENIEEYIKDYIEFENDIRDNEYGLYDKYKEKLLLLKEKMRNK